MYLTYCMICTDLCPIVVACKQFFIEIVTELRAKMQPHPIKREPWWLAASSLAVMMHCLYGVLLPTDLSLRTASRGRL
jgi:hypothetical protein